MAVLFAMSLHKSLEKLVKDNTGEIEHALHNKRNLLLEVAAGYTKTLK